MSGYLRSLAERALGHVAGVRPARGLLSLAGWPLQAGGTTPPADHVEAPSSRMPPPGSFEVAERQIDSTPSDVMAAAQTGEPAETPASIPTTPPHARLALPADADRDGIPARAVLQHADAPREQRSAPSGQPDAAADRRFTRQARAPLEHADRSIVDDRARGFQLEERALNDGAPSPEFSFRVRPAAQIPAAPRVTTRLVRNRFMDPTQSRLEAPAPAPDVHIHIGRVELTAVTSAAPARRESAATPKKPMSLEEYLRRRSGRPS